MKPNHMRSLIAIALTTAFLTACSSDDSPTVEPTTPSTPTTPDTTPTSPTIEFPVQSDAPDITTLDAGSIFVSQEGLSLYTFDNDDLGVSNCNGIDGDEAGSTTDESSCAGTWPPLLAADGTAASGNFTLIARTDGTQQWAYQDTPLYTFAGDSTQGDINGDGLGDVWHLARPQPLSVENINELATYVGNQTIWSASDSAGVLEKFRADKAGFALYIFDNDPVGDAVCYDLNDGGCINAWPPLLADAGAKASAPLSILELSNGEQQWAYKDKPLYFFAGDTQAGETNGDGAGDVWHLATQVPAIQRGDDTGTMLSATGMVYVLNDELEAEQANKDQFTLYTFDNDTANTSNCYGDCAISWPPFLAAEHDVENGTFTKITRDDGNIQWAWNEHPLYFFASDTEAGQANGDGIGGVWHIIQPDEEEPSTSIITTINATDSNLGSSLIIDGEALMLISQSGTDSQETADKTGFQLYTFANDSFEQTACTSDGCKASWPALLATEEDIASAPFSIFTREDGLDQWAFNGQPLYFFTGDVNAGEQNGEAVGDVWWVARPAPLRVFNHESEDNILVATSDVLPSQGKTSEQLTDLTLYTFDDDVLDSGESTCFGGCAVTWPPLYATSEDEAFGEYSIISRQEDDGSQTLQWVYKGLPLYFFTADSQLGDTLGDYPTWQIARP